MIRPLTKSAFLAGQKCLRYLWLDTHKRHLKRQPTPTELARMQAGQELGALARKKYPGGVLMDARPGDLTQAHEETARCLTAQTPILYEAGFLVDAAFVRCDIVLNQPTGLVLVEVKSSTKIRDDHLDDLAFQVHVVRQAGHNVIGARLCHIDSTVTVDASPDPATFFTEEDVTEEVFAMGESMAQKASQCLETMAAESEPDVRVNTHCFAGGTCPYFESHCGVAMAPDDIVFLPGIRRDAVLRFSTAGIDTIKELPTGAKLTSAQERAVAVVRFGEPYVGEGLGDALGQILFPAAFVDFEAAARAIPLIPGLRPYESLPFQWSCHILEHSGAEPVHREFLQTGPGDPRPGFVASLIDAVRDARSLVFYSSYELTTVSALAKAGFPEASELVFAFSSRGVDLLKIVREHIYLEEFSGSFSIKKVLPALVSDLGYGGLAIQDGETASMEYARMVSGAVTDEEAARIADNLRDYCRLDTLAMVRLYQKLSDLAAT